MRKEPYATREVLPGMRVQKGSMLYVRKEDSQYKVLPPKHVTEPNDFAFTKIILIFIGTVKLHGSRK